MRGSNLIIPLTDSPRSSVARLSDNEVDAAAAFLTPQEHQLLVLYDKEDQSLRAIAKKGRQKFLGDLHGEYKAVRAKLEDAVANSTLAALTLTPAPASSTTPVFTAPTSTLASTSSTQNNSTSNLTTPINPTFETMAEEKEIIPMDDPRRIYPIKGTRYALCHPHLTGNLSGHKNTPEEQKKIDELKRTWNEEIKGKTKAEIQAKIDALCKTINDQDEADRLLIEDINRQQDELRAQREVERRVYYRQKALKEEKKKAKEEKARARAIARGEIVDGGEGAAGPSGQAQASGGGVVGAGENSSANGQDHAGSGGVTGLENGKEMPRDQGIYNGHSSTDGSTEFGQDQATGSGHAGGTIDGSGIPQDQVNVDGVATSLANGSEAHGTTEIA